MAGNRAQFRPNNKGIGLILRSAKMKREMEVRARLIEAHAKEVAPRDTGEYLESFKVESGTENSPIKLGRGDRAWAVVKNTSPHAAAVEFGNKHVGDGQRILGQAADKVSTP